MKKYFKIAFAYAIAALVSGVFYREFTKGFSFVGKTSLGVTHLHLFVMGAVMFILLAIISNFIDFKKSKLYKPFMITYNSGLIYMVLMFYVRGIIQVLALELSPGLNAAISGIAGLGHALFGTGVVLLFVLLIKGAESNKKFSEER